MAIDYFYTIANVCIMYWRRWKVQQIEVQNFQFGCSKLILKKQVLLKKFFFIILYLNIPKN